MRTLKKVINFALKQSTKFHKGRKLNPYVLKVCHPLCVKSIIQCIHCVYIYIYMQSKTQQFVREWHYVIYNYMFRPCKWVIIRLFVEPLR